MVSNSLVVSVPLLLRRTHLQSSSALMPMISVSTRATAPEDRLLQDGKPLRPGLKGIDPHRDLVVHFTDRDGGEPLAPHHHTSITASAVSKFAHHSLPFVKEIRRNVLQAHHCELVRGKDYIMPSGK